MPRNRTSPYRYDRAAIRYVLEHEGLSAARARWPRDAVDPIARALHLTKPYRPAYKGLSLEQIAALGAKPDAVLAGNWDLPVATVHVARRLLGIPPAGKEHRKRLLRARLDELTDADLCQPLNALIQRTGLRLHVLMAERKRRNIRGCSTRGAHVRLDVNARRLLAIKALRVACPGITLEEIGEVFKLTRERIRQIEQSEEIESLTKRSA